MARVKVKAKAKGRPKAAKAKSDLMPLAQGRGKTMPPFLSNQAAPFGGGGDKKKKAKKASY